MSDRLHIIIAGNEGKVRNFLLSKRKLQLTSLFAVFLFASLSVTSFNVFHLFHANTDLSKQVARLNSQLNESTLLKDQLALQVNDLQQLNSSQAETFKKEKTNLLNTAVSELEERSSMIERIMCNLGVDVEASPKESSHSGGPFIVPRESIGKEVLFRSDRYLKPIQYLPLGRPVPGPVTSRYGHRTDPVNGKKGFHTGVDMRGRNGSEIKATADGTVKKAFFNGSYGRYVEIDHGNGYTTKFAHMRKLLVKRGDHVKRGQAIGTVGSSGRSTGSHLHYEVCLNNKPINPSKFMRVDKLTQVPVIPRLTMKSKKKKHTLVAAQQNPAAGTSEN